MWKVFNKKLNIVEKEYKYKCQAVIYCYMKGYVFTGIDDFDLRHILVLHPDIAIIKENRKS